jgi:broad specificity phosphatase PhoE
MKKIWLPIPTFINFLALCCIYGVIMVVNITYFAHGTTPDNEQGLFSGQNSVQLSKLGVEQMAGLPKLIKDKHFDVVFTSDLKRGIESAELSFPGYKIIQDKRLRECDVGDLTGKKEPLVDEFVEKNGPNKKFPNGESLKDVEVRIKSLLNDLKKEYPGKSVAIIAHKYTQLAIDVIVKKISWEEAIAQDWRKKVPKAWKPGWDYIINTKYS